MEVMAPDVVLIADGGGLVAAARAPIHGAERVAKLLARADRVLGGFETTAVWLNGAPAGRIEIDGQLAAVSLWWRTAGLPGSTRWQTRGS
jgi:hypothetical protein